MKATVTPVLKSLQVVDSGTAPDLATDGSMYIHCNGGLAPGGVPAVEFEIEVFDVDNPPGELRMIHHARLSNLLAGGAGVIGHDSTDKKLDFVAPYTGGELVDAGPVFPFYDDLDGSAVTYTSEDTPGLWVGPPSLWPLANGDVSQIDVKYNFRMCGVWQFSDTDGTVYFLGNADWSTRIQEQLQMTGGVLSFAAGANNDTVGSSGFVRANADLRTAPPNAPDSTEYMDP